MVIFSKVPPLLHDATVTCSAVKLPLRIPILLDYDDAVTVP